MGNAQGSAKTRKRRAMAPEAPSRRQSLPSLQNKRPLQVPSEIASLGGVCDHRNPSSRHLDASAAEASPLRKRPRSILYLPADSPFHQAPSLETVEEERTEDLRSTAIATRSPTSVRYLSSSLMDLPSITESVHGSRERVGGKFYRSLGRSIQSFRRLTSSRKRKREDDDLEGANSSDLRSACSSQTSLSGTQWPVPWIETTFLPEFGVKTALSERDFVVLNDIGVGSFGAVARVCLQRDRNVFFALKRQRKSDVLSRNAVLQVKNEVDVHKALTGGPFIARFYASFQSRSELFTVSQYAMGYGDMFTLWRDFGSFSEATIRVYAAEIAIALDFVHSKGIVYRDLKLENVVLDVDGHVQIVDFGMAKRLDGPKTKTICGTLQYMAPEIAHGLSYDGAADWWSFGVLLHILLTNRYPFPSNHVQHHLELSFIDYHTPTESSKDFGDLLDSLLKINPQLRLSGLDSLVIHPFFRDVDWNDVENRRVDPYGDIEKMKRCRSCNSLFDRSGSDLSGSDVEENIYAFDEHYQFDEFDYFDDNLT